MKKQYILTHDEVVDALKQYVHVKLAVSPDQIERLELFTDLGVGEGMKPLATSGSIEARITEKDKEL